MLYYGPAIRKFLRAQHLGCISTWSEGNPGKIESPLQETGPHPVPRRLALDRYQ